MYAFRALLRNTLFIGLTISGGSVYAQNYTTLAAGSWTTPANWTNTSGWGDATPNVAGGHGSGTATVNHNMVVTGNYALASATLLVNAGRSVTVTGNFSVGGGGNVNIYGTLDINGNATLNSNLRIFPGGQVIVRGILTVNSSDYLTVGTNTAPPPYADLIVYQNLVSNSSGDITVNQNGRVAVFGNVTAAGGGTLFTVNNGGQVYVHGNFNFTGGGSQITNNNATSPYGLYVNGTITNSGGGSGTTGNTGNKATMQSTNPAFSNWVQNIPGSPLPITLIFFKGSIQNETVELTWATASELNFYGFEIEHSINGQSYEVIGEVIGAGFDTHERHNYVFVATALSSQNYYRLKSVDKDGSYEYSKPVLVSRPVAPRAEFFPNPATDHLSFQIEYEPSLNDRVTVLDPTGNVVLTFALVALETTVTLPPTLKPGVYLVKIQGQVEKISRLLVQ